MSLEKGGSGVEDFPSISPIRRPAATGRRAKCDEAAVKSESWYSGCPSYSPLLKDA